MAIVVSSQLAAICIGTSPISGGTTTRILYDNAGVVGEMTTTGSGTVVALATGAQLVTPALGVATATTLAIGGATIGSSALAVTGIAAFSTTVTVGGLLAMAGNEQFNNALAIQWKNAAGTFTNNAAGTQMFTFSDNALYIDQYDSGVFKFRGGSGGTGAVLTLGPTAATFAGSVTTSAPNTGTAAAWKMGTVAVVSPTSPNRTVELDINGTIYYLAAKTTNN